MAKKKAASSNDLFARLFALIEKRGWVQLSLPSIARALKMPLAELLQTYPDKNALLAGFARHIDQLVAAHEIDSDAPIKERIFEAIMLRLDALAPYKAGAVRLMDELQGHPNALLALGLEAGCQLRRSMQLMLELAHATSGGMRDEALLAGVKLIYLQTLRTWKNDDSADMGNAMAELDKWLERLLRLLRL